MCLHICTNKICVYCTLCTAGYYLWKIFVSFFLFPWLLNSVYICYMVYAVFSFYLRLVMSRMYIQAYSLWMINPLPCIKVKHGETELLSVHWIPTFNTQWANNCIHTPVQRNVISKHAIIASYNQLITKLPNWNLIFCSLSFVCIIFIHL